MVAIVPLYCDRWLAGTAELSLEEQGAYMRWIASYAARDGLFPDDIGLFAQVWRCDIRVARRLRAALLARGKLNIEGGLVDQVLIKSVVANVIAKSTVRADAAFKRWRNHRENNGNGAANADANASGETMQMHMPSTKTPREDKASSPGESQQPPHVDNSSQPDSPQTDHPPATEQDPPQQDPSASARATALPEGAPARSPPPQQDTPMTLAEINARWRPAGTRP